MGRRYEALHHRHSHEKKDVRSRQVRTHVHTTGEKAQRKANATAAKQLTRTAGKESNPHPPATSAEVKVEESGADTTSSPPHHWQGDAANPMSTHQFPLTYFHARFSPFPDTQTATSLVVVVQDRTVGRSIVLWAGKGGRAGLRISIPALHPAPQPSAASFEVKGREVRLRVSVCGWVGGWEGVTNFRHGSAWENATAL
eukprot:RCo035982